MSKMNLTEKEKALSVLSESELRLLSVLNKSIANIESNDIYKRKLVTIQENAPVALMQVSLKSEIGAFKRVKGFIYGMNGIDEKFL